MRRMRQQPTLDIGDSLDIVGSKNGPAMSYVVQAGRKAAELRARRAMDGANRETGTASRRARREQRAVGASLM